MKKLIILLCLLNLTFLSSFSQEKKLLLQFNEIKKSEINKANDGYIEKETIKKTGTILVYSKKVMFRDEKSPKITTYEIGEVQKNENREYYISKDREWIFALTDDKLYLTKIGKKERFIYVIVNYKYAE